MFMAALQLLLRSCRILLGTKLLYSINSTSNGYFAGAAHMQASFTIA